MTASREGNDNERTRETHASLLDELAPERRIFGAL